MHWGTFVRRRRSAAVAVAVMALVAVALVGAPTPVSAAGVTLDVLTGLEGSGQVIGLADGGGVAGNVTDENDNTTAFVWDGLDVFHVLPSGANSSEATAFNGAGTLTGTAVGSGGFQAFVRTADGTIYTADFGNGLESQAADVNDDGTVVGVAIDAQNKTTPFTWTPPAAPELWPLASESFSQNLNPRFINDAGQISGAYIDQGDDSIFFWDPTDSDTIHFIEDLANFPDADLIGMTESGLLVMTATENSQSTTYTWTLNANTTPLENSAFDNPRALGVNHETGAVVGQANGGATPFLWTPTGGFTALASCGSDGEAGAVNADGQVVGGCQSDPSANLAPNVWRSDESASLGIPSAYTEGGAGFVNDAGLVAGTYVDQEGTSYPFTASVVFETSPPQALAARASDGRVDLTWQAPADDGNEGPHTYNVYESGALIGTVGGDVRSFSHTGLTNGTAYAYTVTAVNSAGESDPSDLVTAVPGSSPVARPVVATPRVTG